jgi:hypothetical protein
MSEAARAYAVDAFAIRTATRLRLGHRQHCGDVGIGVVKSDFSCYAAHELIPVN